MTISAPASKTDKPVDGSTQDQGNSANQPSQLVDKIITALRIQLAAKDERLSAKDAVIAANNAVIAAKDVWLSIKDPLLATKDAELEEIFVKVETLTARVAELETIAHHHRKYIGTADTADPTVLQCADKDIATSEDEPVQPDAQPAAVGTSGPDTADNSSDACMTNVAEIIPVPPFMEWSQPVADSEPYSIMELLYCPICVPICVAVVDFKEDKSSIDLSLVISCIPPGQRPDIIVAYGVECSALDDLDNWTFKSTTSSVGSNKFVVGWNKSKLRGTIDDPVLRCNNIKFTVCQTIYDPLVLQFINIGSKQGFVGEESLTRPLYKSINRQRKLVFGNAFDIKGNKGRVSHGLDGLIYDYRHGKLRYNSQAISDDNTSTPGNIGWTEYPTLQCVINIFPLTEITRSIPHPMALCQHFGSCTDFKILFAEAISRWRVAADICLKCKYGSDDHHQTKKRLYGVEANICLAICLAYEVSFGIKWMPVIPRYSWGCYELKRKRLQVEDAFDTYRANYCLDKSKKFYDSDDYSFYESDTRQRNITNERDFYNSYITAMHKWLRNACQAGQY